MLEESRDENGAVTKAKVFYRRYVESDAALLDRVLGRDIGKKQSTPMMPTILDVLMALPLVCCSMSSSGRTSDSPSISGLCTR